ncbi:MAG: hypothetical protein ACOYM1_05710 [Methylovulum sp.]|jgi:hypothetical protein
MKPLRHWLFSILRFFYAIKTKQLQWHTTHHAQQARLKHAQRLAHQDIIETLTLRSAQLEHDLAMLKTTHKAQLLMLKTQCKQDIKDYQAYLSALDKLKITIQTSYQHLPEAVAFTIHHHAKQLLNALWIADTVEEKLRCELRLIHFMNAVHEDACVSSDDAAVLSSLPKKTLALLQQPLL